MGWIWGLGFLLGWRVGILNFSCTMFFNSSSPIKSYWYESLTENFLGSVDDKAEITDFRFMHTDCCCQRMSDWVLD